MYIQKKALPYSFVLNNRIFVKANGVTNGSDMLMVCVLRCHNAFVGKSHTVSDRSTFKAQYAPREAI